MFAFVQQTLRLVIFGRGIESRPVVAPSRLLTARLVTGGGADVQRKS